MYTTEEEFIAAYPERMKKLEFFKKSGIYYIWNLVNNKLYIGKSVNVKKRIAEHKRQLRANKHFNNHLQMAWNKYGEENFMFTVVEKCDCIEDLAIRENKNIKLYKPEYNSILVNDEGNWDYPEEAKEKLRKLRTGKKHTEETKRKIGQLSLGRKWTEETRRKYKETRARNNYKHPPEVMERIKNKLIGKVRSPETLKRMSESQIGHVQSKEAIAKMVAAQKLIREAKRLSSLENV